MQCASAACNTKQCDRALQCSSIQVGAHRMWPCFSHLETASSALACGHVQTGIQQCQKEQLQQPCMQQQ